MSNSSNSVSSLNRRRKVHDWLSKHAFIIAAILIPLVLALGGIGLKQGWSFSIGDDIFWLLIAAIIGLVAMLDDHWQNALARRTQIQLSFFERWQELRTKIEKLQEKKYSSQAKNILRRYFELIHLEYLMLKEIDPTIWENWTASRQSEFEDQKTKYAGRTLWQWWQDLKENIVDETFKIYIEDCFIGADRA